MAAILTAAITSGGTVLAAVVAEAAGYLGARRGTRAGWSLAASSGCGRTASACTRSWPRGCGPIVQPTSQLPGQVPVLLTDLLTRPGGTGETQQGMGNGQRPRFLVSETGGYARDTEYVRRMSHNPEVAGSNPAPATRK
jgi:hypothetical protein